jgi:hypothetical protein
MSSDQLVDKLGRGLRKMRNRILRDPKYAAWLGKWFYENPDAWASILRVCTMTKSHRPTVPEKGTWRKIPPRERAAACRRAVLEYLVSLPLLAFGADAIARHLNGDETLAGRHNPGGPDWTEREVGRAADALTARGLLLFNFNWFCDRKYYQATGEGVRTAAAQHKGNL